MVQAKSEMEVGTWTQKFRSSKKAESSTILRANRKQPFLNHFLTCSHCFLPSFLPPCLPPFFTFSFFLWTALGLGCCLRAFSGCSAQPSGCQGFCCCSTQAWGACASQGGVSWALECAGFRSCGSWSSWLHSMWNLLRPGIEPTSPAVEADSYPPCQQGSPKSKLFNMKLHHTLYNILSLWSSPNSCMTSNSESYKICWAVSYVGQRHP